MLHPKQKTARGTGHPETETQALPETIICSTQYNTQNFESTVFIGFSSG